MNVFNAVWISAFENCSQELSSLCGHSFYRVGSLTLECGPDFILHLCICLAKLSKIEFKLPFMGQMAFCYPASATSLGSYLSYCQTPSHSHSACGYSKFLSEPSFVLSLGLHIVNFLCCLELYFWYPNPFPHYLHQEKVHTYSFRSYLRCYFLNNPIK